MIRLLALVRSLMRVFLGHPRDGLPELHWPAVTRCALCLRLTPRCATIEVYADTPFGRRPFTLCRPSLGRCAWSTDRRRT